VWGIPALAQHADGPPPPPPSDPPGKAAQLPAGNQPHGGLIEIPAGEAKAKSPVHATTPEAHGEKGHGEKGHGEKGHGAAEPHAEPAGDPKGHGDAHGKGHGDAHGEHGGAPEEEEASGGIHLPTWLYGALKKVYTKGPASVTFAGATDSHGQALSDADRQALVGQVVNLHYEDHHSLRKPRPTYDLKPTIAAVGAATEGAHPQQITVDGRTLTVFGADVAFAWEKAMPELLVISLLTALGIALVSLFLTTGMQRVPSRRQALAEVLYTFFDGFVKGLIGPTYKRYLALMLTLFLYIFTMNVAGVIPGWASPTANVNVTAGMAITMVIFVQYEGIRANGFVGYLKHFVGQPVWLCWLNIPLHILGEFAKVLSLSIRLFGNIFGEDVVIVILIMLAGLATAGWLPMQAPMTFFAVFTSLVQAVVFTMLSCIYIKIMTSHEGDDHGGGHDHGHDHEPGHAHAHAH